ncbi:MAG: helix-turn-helix domain-containing protein [Candidatus Kerfeldbacteria bacterium]|nr:helix-turn-helix domain-containing protein [Candidatus Kerfeldbacteria bacterium]
MDNDRFMTKQEVADLLHLSPFTIDQWVSKRRNLPYVKIGRKVMFYESDIREYLRRQTVVPESSTTALPAEGRKS